MTGAASGIGRATAVRLAAEGAQVIALDRNRSGVAETIRELERNGGAGEPVELNLLEDSSTASAAEAIRDRHPALHGLINCAGLVHVDGAQENPFIERGLAGWDEIFGVNVRGLAGLVHALVPTLAAGRGVVVNVSSEAAYRSRAGRWIYDASKAALLSVTRSMAAALASDEVRVVGVAPGGTITEMHLNDHPDPEAARERMRTASGGNLLGRLAEPEEIAAAIAFLGSADASFVTGTTLAVDGGGAGSR